MSLETTPFKFETVFGDVIALYKGVVRIWIETEGEDAGKVKAEYRDGAIQELGFASDYAYAKANGYTGTMEEWVTTLLGSAQNAIAANEAKLAAQSSASDAENSSIDAEAWAVGKRNGTDVTSEDETYQNNSKYYSDLADAKMEEFAQVLTSAVTVYQNSSDGTTPPTGTWSETPAPQKGMYTWAKTTFMWASGAVTETYAVSYQGTDGKGLVSSVNGKEGIVELVADDIPYEIDEETGETTTTVNDALNTLEKGVSSLNSRLTTKANSNNPNFINSISMGRKANSTVGPSSVALGSNVVASLNWAAGFGYNTTASASYAFAQGNQSIASGIGSVAFGYNTRSEGQYSFAEGSNAQAKSDYSHAEGSLTKASGGSSHAEGESTKASGVSSHAEGNRSEAQGDNSHAEGNYAIASGVNSHAEGDHTEASGAASHADGHYTIAAGDYQHVSGTCNVAQLTEWPMWTSGTSYAVGNVVRVEIDGSLVCKICTEENSDTEFDSSKWADCSTDYPPQFFEIVGVGTSSDNRANGRALDMAGNEYLKGDIYVQCNNDSTGGHKLMTEPSVLGTNGQVLTSDGQGGQSWQTMDLSGKLDKFSGHATFIPRIASDGQLEYCVRSCEVVNTNSLFKNNNNLSTSARHYSKGEYFTWNQNSDYHIKIYQALTDIPSNAQFVEGENVQRVYDVLNAIQSSTSTSIRCDFGTVDTLPIVGTFEGVTEDMIVSSYEIGTPNAFSDELAVTTSKNTVQIDGSLYSGASSTVKIVLTKVKDVQKAE